MQEQATKLAKGPLQAEQSANVTQGWFVEDTVFSGLWMLLCKLLTIVCCLCIFFRTTKVHAKRFWMH
jgi:hypothetical protein